MKPPTQRTVTLVRPTDAAPTQHGDGAHAVAPSAPVPIAVPDDVPLRLSVALCWPMPGRTARNVVLNRLRTFGWGGSEDAASRVADVLATNAADHAAALDCGEIPLRLVILPDNQLLIEVDDGTPDFPDFNKAQAEASVGRGLWWVSHYRGRLTYFPLLDDQGETVGKTVQVLLPATWGEAA
ncbi:hypothetical protein ACWD26_29410 [Streptomyces sp. NPDC002787]